MNTSTTELLKQMKSRAVKARAIKTWAAKSRLGKTRIPKALATATIFSVLLASCVSTPQSPPGAADVRAKLTRLQSDSNLGSRAPVEIKEAETAVKLAEIPVPRDKDLGAYRVYLADYKVEIAEAKATTRYAEDQRVELSKQREDARLNARTREAEIARSDANRARDDADAARRARDDAEEARRTAENTSADAARRAELALKISEDALARAAADADLQKAELQRQIDLLEAKTTERGLVLTLGNVLFETGRSELKPGAATSLDKLVAFLKQYPDRNAVIEGHTDNVGTSVSNQALSQRRADSVNTYLLQHGIQSQRLTASGMGEDQPVADNNSENGRQQNRRVEIIIDNPPMVATAMTGQESTP
jgi:outer membrane protein OmpA-like peptidoglycan-associated protein